MAEASSNDQNSFNCPICLDLLKEPVTIPCGHSYCMMCIKNYWDHVQRGGYSCPQCRQTFTPRPALNKNTLIAEMVEKIKTMLNAPASGPGDVECDFCTGRKQKAVKSCLVCLASYCETHLRPHHESPAFKNHSLVQATKQLQERVCSLHQKPLEVFCHTDQLCICVVCAIDKHKRHKVATAAAYREEKQKQLWNIKSEFLQRIMDKETDLRMLKRAVESHKSSAQVAIECTEKIFSEHLSFLLRKQSEVVEMIKAQERASVRQAEILLEELEQEIADLKRRTDEIEELLQTHDHIHFLQSFQSLSAPIEAKDLPTLSDNSTFADVEKSLSELKDQLEDFSTVTIGRIDKEVKAVEILKKPEPRTREEFLQHSCQLTLDTNTTNRLLWLSEGNKKVTCSKEGTLHPSHPERFVEYEQVLCREGLAGCCYWELEWSGKLGVSIAMAYKGLQRAGLDSLFGRNHQSWRLRFTEKNWHFWHNDNKSEVPKVPNCSRIGVYLDHEAGTLSFYSVSDTMTLLHKVKTKFNRPLYAGFKINCDSTLRICDL
ncbi:tripartite motif-containing protein 16-like [Colossoma macropomum]|uniref:tripartite motif-containing protein 16-like n=1 Tax=Colossoma macropomum TaxID=42526 RepID=UPI001864990B|nr:tripartite motif-containing protein 16-like [Colossoma macropomum]